MARFAELTTGESWHESRAFRAGSPETRTPATEIRVKETDSLVHWQKIPGDQKQLLQGKSEVVSGANAACGRSRRPLVVCPNLRNESE